MTAEYLLLEDFIKMKSEEVSDLVSSSPVAEAGTLINDGNRRAGMIFYGLDPSRKGFDKKIDALFHREALRVIKTFFHNGVKTLYCPFMSHANFYRGKAYMDALIEVGLDFVFRDPLWLSFYDENNIRVKCYGDREFIKQMGFTLLLDLMQEIEEKTAANNGRILFFGFACTRSLEETRLSSIGIDLFKKLGRAPTKAELIKTYFRMDAPDVGFCVRACEVRDSDCQPVLVTGPKTQMYFPVIPLFLLSERAIRCILYDLIVYRVASKGLKIYSRVDTDKMDISRIREYYELNRDAVLGLGVREGPFWIPNSQVKMLTDIPIPIENP